MNLEDVIRRGTRAAQPAATAVPKGTLYYVTDEIKLERSTGAAWESYSGTIPTSIKYNVGITVDGSGSVLTTGLKGFRSIPMNGTITRYRILAKESGSITFDIWKDLYSNFPPSIADTIVASAHPTISSGVKNEDTTLTGWTKTVTAGDVLAFNIDSVTTITRVTLELEITT